MNNYRIPSIITSIEELRETIREVRKLNFGAENCLVFRGQGRNCWKLKPKIARYINDADALKELEKKMTTEFLVKLQNTDLNKHIQVIKSEKEHLSKWMLIQQAQHFELPTRFMDWSGDWEVALCFAVANEFDDEFDGQLWLFFVPNAIWEPDVDDRKYLNNDPFEFAQNMLLRPSNLYESDYLLKIANRRLLRQMGRFYIQPYNKIFIPLEEQEEYKHLLHKIIIPSHLKRDIRNILAKTNVTLSTLMFENDEVIQNILLHLNPIVANIKENHGFII